ncbi:Ig-like domain-containing protein [Fusibacter tunisiensis]|uniref:Prepilin-type N-terminal cleavage/methylation domain-containing protein n=1 Tax=Fusibacter tunisiensis TaxID=1008308 RepID=A0ABS2MPQ5_9FIRM|nr:Ig-like domain-containing protein [Fusibacter tunisiensis]MBM7561385.1 prepilin-type N-terminal cleavage/methylation domain-containing protein [Fusibacter tunisiensis]
MRRKKGFTLVEIIVAIGLIGLLSAGFLGVISDNYGFLFETKQITEDAFLTQKQMELSIEDLKEDIDTGGVTLTTVNLFENIPVSYAELSEDYDGRKFFTYVSDTRLPQIEKLKISDVAIRLNYNVFETVYAYNYAPTNLEAVFTNDSLTLSDLMVNLYAWYVSKPGYNMPVPKGPDSSFNYLEDVPEADIFDRYPVFPRDYELIATETSNGMLDLSAYSGRHIVLTVTPAAKSGRIGETGISIPVHIHGLEDTSNLALHLDASYIDPYNPNEVLSSADRRVIRWYDLASNIGEAAPTEYMSNSNASSRPALHDTDPLNSFVSRYIRFTNTSSLAIVNQNTLGETVNYFAVVRGRDAAAEETIFTNGSYTAKLIEDSNNKLSSDEWYLVSGSYVSDGNDFLFGNSDFDIIEFLAYTDSIDAYEISNYIKSKYVPLDSDAEIVSLYNLSETAYVGDSYALPNTVLADMSFGSDRFVSVEWNGTVDTSAAGTFLLTGTAKSDTTKSMTLTVNVVEKELVDTITLTPDNLEFVVGDSETVVVDVLPENAYDKSVVWSSSDESIATVSNGVVTGVGAGTAIISAASNDGNAVSSISVNVLPYTSDYTWPEGMILQLDASLANESENDSSLPSWIDRSSAGNHFIQNTNTKRPTWNKDGLNNFYTVSFDGFNDSMVYMDSELGGDGNEDFYSSNTNSFSVFVVGQSLAENNSETFFSKAGGWGGSATYAIGTTNGNFAQKLRGKTISTSGDINFNYHTSIWNGTNHIYYINGSEESVESSGSASNQNNNVAIGASKGGTGQYLKGDIAEIIVFNRNLTLRERQYVENYLRLKWFSMPLIAWDFSDSGLDGWQAITDISSFEHVSTGIVRGNITNSDPHIVSIDDLNITINNSNSILLRLKNITSSDTGQIYFTTTLDSEFDETKHIDFEIVPNSDFTDYIIYMGSNSKWEGTLKQLRIDPAVNSNGSFEIDFIRILD